jgi:hypothetical protein
MMKQIEPKRVTICEVEFAIYPFGAMKAANLSGELGRFLGPIVAGVLPLIGSNEDVLQMDLKAAMPLVTEAFSSLDGDVVEKLLRKLILDGNINCRYMDESTGKFIQSKLTQELADSIFCQQVDELYKLAFEVINLNYSGFFKKLLDQYGDLSQKTQNVVLRSTESLTKDNLANLN